MRAHLWRRQAASTPGASAVIVVIVLAAAVLLTAWPRLTEHTFTDEARHQIVTAGATQRAVIGEFNQPGGTFMVHDPQTIADTLADIADDAGPHLTPALDEPRFSVTQADEFSFTAPGGRPQDLANTYLQMRLDPDITDQVEVTDGSLPGPRSPDQDIGQWAAAAEQDEPVDIMLSVATAEAMGLQVGDEFTGVVFQMTAWLRVSGVFEPLDADADQWQHQLSTAQPLLLSDPNVGDTMHGYAYVHPDNADWLALLGEARVHVWIPVHPALEDPAGLLADLRTMTATEHVLENEWEDVSFSLDSSLIPIMQTAIDRWQSTATVLAMLAAGPVGVLAAVLALATRLAVIRRQDTLALASARGGSPAQVRTALGAEGLLLGAPAAAFGALVATLVTPGPLAVGHYLGAAGAALAPAVLLATAPLPNLRTTRADLRGRSSSKVRWVVEVLVLAAAAASVYLVQMRGLVTGAGTDPLSIATPLLLSLAAALLAVRVLPLPLAAVHRVLRGRRGLSGFLGSARVMREGHGPLVPVLALLVGISIAVFSTVMLSTLRTGTEDAGLVQAGADVRVAGPTLPEETLESINDLPGVEIVTPVTTLQNVPLAVGSRSDRTTLVALDTATLPQVQDQVPGALELPPGMDVLDDDGRVPILVSGLDDIDADDVRLVMTPSVESVVVGEPQAAPGVTEAPSWVLADLELVRAQSGSVLMPRLALISLTGDADATAVITGIEELTEGIAVVTSPVLNVEQFLTSPSSASLERGFVAALAITVALSMAAIVLTLVLAAPARGRLVAVLRTLGAGSRVARAMVSWETLPLVAISVLFGAALGLTLPLVLTGAMDLRPFTGGAVQPELVYDPLLLTGVVAAVGVVMTVSVLVAAAVAHRLSMSVLRIGDPT